MCAPESELLSYSIHANGATVPLQLKSDHLLQVVSGSSPHDSFYITIFSCLKIKLESFGTTMPKGEAH